MNITEKQVKPVKFEINPAFGNLIGQDSAKLSTSMYLAAIDNGEPIRHSLITGRTGLGKTAFADAMMEAYKAKGFDVQSFGCPTEILGATATLLFDKIKSADKNHKVAIHIGEAHRMKSAGRVQLKRLHAFIMLHADDKNLGRGISINDGEIGVDTVTRDSIAFVLDTNFPAQLEEGKQSTSFKDRLRVSELEDYTHEEIEKILSLMVKDMGLRLHPSCISTVANCARGTARPLMEISKSLREMQSALHDKSATLNKTEVLEAIRLAKQYPHGLTMSEVRLLAACEHHAIRQNVVIQLFPNVEPGEIRKSLAFLQSNRKNSDGVEIKPFLYLGPKGYTLTGDDKGGDKDGGRAYLKAIAKLGFTW